MTALHEGNYAKLQRVVPCIRHLRHDTTYRAQRSNQHIEISILEKTKYTTTFSLTLVHESMQRWIPKIFMTVRTYHDARVAEVLNFQHHSRFQAQYDYPNPRMFHTNEKQQINRFFNEWLDHCLKSQLRFDSEFESIDA
jgi:uncharacterized protein YqiB (DUF1249 family)